MKHVVVIGAGIAGTAAALAAARAGARVTIIVGPPGASVLAGGALDDVPWDASPEEAAPLDSHAEGVLAALSGYRVGPARVLLPVATGLVRPARGSDAALIDVARLGPGTVLVPDVEHGSWDGSALASEWSASPLMRKRSLRFVAARASLVARTEERSLTNAEMAARHDDPERLEWLALRIRETQAALGRPIVGVVLPPWLGVVREQATALSARVGVPCGEALGGVGGPAGLRFERARDRAFANAGVTIAAGRALSVRAAKVGERESPWSVDAELRGENPISFACDAVVLATGGLLGGGLEYTPAGAYEGRALPERPRSPLRLTCDASVRLGAFGRAVDDPSSLFGAAPEAHAWPYRVDPLLDHVGVLVHDGGEVKGALPGFYAAGEVAAGPPHTWLAALTLGANVGQLASD